MSFLDHLEELRWHIIRSLLVIVVFAVIAYINIDFLFEKVIFGPRYADFATYQFLCWFGHLAGLGEKICIQPATSEVITTGIGEAFTMSLTVAMSIGLIAAFPYIFWEAWRFVRPGLKGGEANAATGIIFIGSFLFFLGVLFGYFVIAPAGINFLVGYKVAGVANKSTLDSYINYMLLFVLPPGATFELPLVTYFLARFGLVTAEFMRKYRRYAILIVLIVAAIITP
ncbi:MAG: hypothetical protein RI894_130, partial [Bacteroidota bacterium]